MFVRMAHWECRPECWDKAVEMFENRALPVLEKQPGILRAQLTGESDSGKRIAITYWESEEAHSVFAASPALAEITDIFLDMYVDGVRPEGFFYPVIREQAFA
ncbi:MAG: hypothetical protein CL569_08430 [Alphaproteobacteria bacterium]|nr:hypothetical protein [Alphaproteobacteria bacterium]